MTTDSQVPTDDLRSTTDKYSAKIFIQMVQFIFRLKTYQHCYTMTITVLLYYDYEDTEMAMFRFLKYYVNTNLSSVDSITQAILMSYPRATNAMKISVY